MHTQNGLKKDASLAKFVLGAHPIIEHFIETLRIREIIGSYLPTDRRMKLDDGKALALLIHNILTSPNPLYEMEDWLKPLDAEKVGLRPGETKWIQDDRIGRALAKFYDSRHKDVFFRLALRAIKVFDLDCGRIHHDTTSFTVVGKYGGWSASERLALGNNKDHRPDLKQLVLGLNVTADGAVPISHQIYDGNQTDDRLHPANHQALQKLLGAGRLRFGSQEQLKSHLGVDPGSVSLLAVFNDTGGAVTLIVDNALWAAEAFQFHPLVNTSTLLISNDNLKRFLALTGHDVKILTVPSQK